MSTLRHALLFIAMVSLGFGCGAEAPPQESTQEATQARGAVLGSVPPAAPGSSLTGFMVDGDLSRTYFLGADNHVYELWYDGKRWHHADLTQWAAAPNAALGSALTGFTVTDSGGVRLSRFARLQLLKRYLPSIAVDQVLDERMDEALAVGGQQVTVTLMSTDLRGFTAMSEELQPEQVVEQLNAYHVMMLEEVRRHGGILDKFIGDGMLVVFGMSRRERALTSAPDTGAQAAVSCARSMLQALERLNATRAEQGLPPLRIGVGLHTGPVIAGNIGVPGHRIEFTVIGDAVNTAARLEGLTKEAGTPVLISGESVRRMSEPAGLVPRSAVTLRGKTQPLEIFMLGELSPPA